MNKANENGTSYSMGIHITNKVEETHFEVLYGFYQDTFWGKGRSKEQFRTAVSNSLCFVVMNDESPIGFTRVVTDRAVFSYLMDMYVCPKHRGKGIGKRLLQTVLTHHELVHTKILLRSRDAIEFYTKEGFTPLSFPEHFLLFSRQADR